MRGGHGWFLCVSDTREDGLTRFLICHHRGDHNTTKNKPRKAGLILFGGITAYMYILS